MLNSFTDLFYTSNHKRRSSISQTEDEPNPNQRLPDLRMKIKLAYKLFGALLLTLLMVIGALMLSRYLFARNFKTYIFQVEVERLKNLVPLLQEEYRNNNGWEGIKRNRRYWRRRLWHEIQLPDPSTSSELEKKGGMGHHRPGQKYGGVRIRYLLSDAALNPIIGRPLRRDKPRLVPIPVDGRTVGWLGLTHAEQFPKGPPSEFIQQQYRLYSVLGLVVFFITLFIAVLLTRHLLRPVKRLTEGTRMLARRDFSVRIKETGVDEFGQLAEHFNSMAQTLQTYERMRKQWLGDISHELRTPIAILRGEIEALLDGVRQPTPKHLKSLHTETLRIGKLVDDLHMLSLADSNELTLKMELLSPTDVLDRTIEMFRKRFDRREIRLVENIPELVDICICADQDRLEQVFANILENVCRYVQRRGLLTIGIEMTNDAVLYTFDDSGPGVPEKDLPHLFDRLYRVDTSRKREGGGSGLGLSICKKIVGCHGGSIWAENNVGGGLTIGIRLPQNNNECASS